MSLTWGQVKTWSSTGLSSYAGKVGTRRDTVVKQADALQQSMTSFQGEGETAQTLRDKMTTAHEALTTLADDLAEVQDAVSTAAGNVSEVESAVKKATSEAKSRMCSISDSGVVTYENTSYMYTEQGKNDALLAVTLLVSQALALAEYADASFVTRLGSAGMPGSTSSASGKGTHAWSKKEQDAFQKMSPEERAKYWSEQSYEQKQYLADHYPQLIGNADGVEAWARDRANRINLKENKLKAEKQVEQLKAAERDPNQAANREKIKEEREKVEREIASYEAVEASLKNGISLEEYQQQTKSGDCIGLLTLQNDGRRVKAAVCQGDVDHAQNIATLVPGIGTTVDGDLDKYVRESGNLRQSAAEQGNIPVSNVATIAWLGYDAPGGPDDPDNWRDIASPKLAEAGAERLAGFMTGVQASREYGAGDAHMTLLGHSYGSSTSGKAATLVKDGVIDDLVMFGSPGMGTYDPSDLHVDEDHRWVSGVPYGDSVQGLGRFKFFGLGGLGKNPMDEDSTFKHLSGDATGYEGYDNDARTGFANHDVYLKEGTETLKDFGRVIAGVKE